MSWWLETPERWFNGAEAGLWFVLALGLVIYAVRRADRLAGVAAAVLVPFGVSDLVEAHTGVWWDPWWLLVWKAACVLALVWCGWRLWRRPSGAS